MSGELTERPDTNVDGANATVSDIAANLLVSGQADSIALPSGNTSAIYGLTRGIIKAGKQGSVMLRGKGILMAGTAGVTKGDRIMPEAATGKGITWTSGNSVVGLAMTTAAANALFEIEMLGPGATAQ